MPQQLMKQNTKIQFSIQRNQLFGFQLLYFKTFLWLGVLFIGTKSCLANDTLASSHFKRNLYLTAASYTTALTTVSISWYGNEPQSTFHLFNDGRQWYQLDKMGHAWSCWTGNRGLYRLLSNQYSKNKSLKISTVSSILLMVPIEILDGFSPSYGASLWDIFANSTGALGFYVKERYSLPLKYSFTYQYSPYAKERPSVLGSNFIERILKDYNGHTYGLSYAPFSKNKNIYYSGISIYVGLGAKGMRYARISENTIHGFQSSRLVRLSLDWIPPDSWQPKRRTIRWIKTVLTAIKVPFLALELDLTSKKIRGMVL